MLDCHTVLQISVHKQTKCHVRFARAAMVGPNKLSRLTHQGTAGVTCSTAAVRTGYTKAFSRVTKTLCKGRPLQTDATVLHGLEAGMVNS